MPQDREMHNLVGPFQGVVEHHGSFAPNGTSTISTVKGCIKSVARTGTGAFTITLADFLKGSAYNVVSCIVQARFSALTATVAQILAIDLSAGTITMTTFTTSSGAAVDISANAANRVDLTLVLKQKSLPDGSGL